MGGCVNRPPVVLNMYKHLAIGVIVHHTTIMLNRRNAFCMCVCE